MFISKAFVAVTFVLIPLLLFYYGCAQNPNANELWTYSINGDSVNLLGSKNKMFVVINDGGISCKDCIIMLSKLKAAVSVKTSNEIKLSAIILTSCDLLDKKLLILKFKKLMNPDYTYFGLNLLQANTGDIQINTKSFPCLLVINNNTYRFYKYENLFNSNKNKYLFEELIEFFK